MFARSIRREVVKSPSLLEGAVGAKILLNKRQLVFASG